MKGQHLTLRTLEPTDLDFLVKLENNQDNWLISQTRVPFSRAILTQYIQSAQDIFITKQIRFVITNTKNNSPIGCIDLFDFDPINQRVGIGIIISPSHRQKGYATEALQLLITYCFDILLVHSIYCNILTTNKASIQLFTQQNFKLVGTKRDWINTPNGWADENLYQLIR